MANSKDLFAKGGIADQYLEILSESGLSEELKEQLSAQFSSLDISNIEALNKFRYDLIHTYGIEED
jgi:hypothetical protein